MKKLLCVLSTEDAMPEPTTRAGILHAATASSSRTGTGLICQDMCSVCTKMNGVVTDFVDVPHQHETFVTHIRTDRVCSGAESDNLVDVSLSLNM